MSKQVHDMFDGIARRYDVANDVLSMGIHRLWRHKAIRIGKIGPGASVIDLCTGTGDFAFALGRAVSKSGKVVGMDFVATMLSCAAEKLKAFTLSSTDAAAPTFIQGDAMNLPFEDSCADAVTIGFGIRNVDAPVDCLREILRVLRPTGKVVILEFGQPTLPGFSAMFRWYSKHIMPLIGQALTGDRSAYEYLPRTSAAFPAREQFLRLLEEAGFSAPAFVPLTGGIAYIYTASKAA